MQLRLKPVSLFLALGVAATVAACGGTEDTTTDPAEAPGTEETAPVDPAAPPAETPEEPAEGGEGGEG